MTAQSHIDQKLDQLALQLSDRIDGLDHQSALKTLETLGARAALENRLKKAPPDAFAGITLDSLHVGASPVAL